ncbi:MAG TPA: hypothetical protein VLJ76_06460 [Gaiellaceae bacterium]|nr:hypothetical protein [Gaiellaceae bacterium]
MARVWLLTAIVLALSALPAGGSNARTLIVLDRSIGGVALKELRSNVERELGKGLVLQSTVDKTAKPTPARSTEVSYGSGALLVYYASAKGFPARAELIETTATRYQTRFGLGVGSSYPKLVAAGGVDCYGGTECQHGYHTLNKRGTTFWLDRPHGKVIRIGMTFGH